MGKQTTDTSPPLQGSDSPPPDATTPPPAATTPPPAAPSDSAPGEKLVKYRAAGADYILRVAANGDLLHPDTGAVVVTGAQQMKSGSPLTEGYWQAI